MSSVINLVLDNRILLCYDVIKGGISMSWYDSLQFSCDWLNVVVDVPDLSGFISDLCSAANLVESEFVPMDKGQNFYKYSLSYRLIGYSSFTLSFSPDSLGRIPTSYSEEHPQHGILVSVSGDACRYLRNVSKSWTSFVRFLYSLPHTATRVDMAMDIFDRLNPIVPLFQDFSKVAYTLEKGQIAIKGLFRKPGYVRYIPVYDPDEGCYTDNVYIGDRTSSRGHCVVYNKKEEIRQGRLSSMAQEIFDSVGMTDNYWYRVEYRAKKGLADSVFANLACSTDMDAFYSLAENLFCFVVLKYSGISHISQVDVVTVWNDFLLWMQQHKTIYFVEYHKSTQTYVPADGKRAINWLQRMSVFVAYLSMIEHYMPYLAEDLRRRGSEKLRTSGRQRRIDEDMFSIMNSGEFDYLSYKDPSGWVCPSSAPAQVNINNYV